MEIWTLEEEAARLKARFNGVNRSAFARENNIKNGHAMIFQHINGARPISRDFALIYAKGFKVPLSEISPRLALEAQEVNNLGAQIELDQKLSTLQDATLQVIKLMESTDDLGRRKAWVAVEEIVNSRKKEQSAQEISGFTKEDFLNEAKKIFHAEIESANEKSSDPSLVHQSPKKH